MTRIKIASIAIFALIGTARVLAAEPTGLWLTGDGESKIRITACGTKLCGMLAWLKAPNDAAGQPLRDDNNSDPALRARPMLGLPLFQGLSRSADQWTGKIYNPEDGKMYDSTLVVTGPDTAEIQGCVAVVLCQTEKLTRQ